MSELKDRYIKEIVPKFMESKEYVNELQVPKLEKIVINMGISNSVDKDSRQALMVDMSMITGQWPVIRKARKSIASFKIRKGDPVGILVTLRGIRMYEFMERFIHTVLPRLRDFRGISRKAFDGDGNYSIGLKEQSLFPEINPDKVKHSHGMDITIVTSADNDKAGTMLLEQCGMPFEK
jgi:large subunit ribosomal protein L5